jgi:negative regulator of sigma E activity
MKREVWEELVDRVVDDECADEEKRALYEAAERDPEIRDALDSALQIRKLMRRSAGATVPPEFSERLRLAIERSDFWVEREVERPAILPATKKTSRFGGRRLQWAATSAAVAFAAFALLASSVGDGARWGGVETARLDKTEKMESLANVDESATSATAASTTGENVAAERSPRLPIRTPQNATVVPEATPVPYADGFYTRRVLDAADARQKIAAFLRICREAGVAYEKFGGDSEFLLTKTTPDARTVILRWLDENAPEIAPRADNNLAETWGADDENLQNVRVSFWTSEKAPVGETE